MVLSAKTGQVQSVVRALTILKTLANHRDGLILTEIAKAVDLPRSTTHRLLTTMDSQRFVLFDTETNHWTIGPQAFIVGASFGGMRDIARLGEPFIRSLNMTSQETVNLALSEKESILVVGQRRSRLGTPQYSKVGDRLPLHLSAAGRSMMAWWQDSEITAHFASIDMCQQTEKSVTEAQKLVEKLQRSRERGYAFESEENIKGMCCVGAPVFNSQGKPTAAISISAPPARMNRSRMHALGRELRATAFKLSDAIGGHLPEEIHR